MAIARPRRVLLGCVVAGIALTGCFTGERPSFAPATPTVVDPALAAVVDRLDTADAASPYTATYRILTKLVGVSTATSTDVAGTTEPTYTDAVVARTSPTAITVTIGSVRFEEIDGISQTCDVATGTCEQGLLDERVSQLLVTHSFYADAAAARLRQDERTMIASGLASTRDIAGYTATCVQVSFAGGNKTYCALDNGLLAYQDSPDLQIELTALVTS